MLRNRESGNRTRARARDAGRAVITALVLLSLMAAVLVAQEAPRRLTLDEAIRIAKRNNPTFQSTRNDQAVADWQVREAYAAFLPTATASGSAGFTEAGTQRIGTLDFGTQSTDWYSSSYDLSLNWSLSGNTIFGVPAARASRKATEAGVAAAEFNLESQVALQYMAVLRAEDGVGVAQRQLDRARQNLRIVQTRVSSGAAAGTDGKQAQVDLGRAEVGLIQAQRQLREAKALLAEQLGVPLSETVDLASEFSVFEPTWNREELMATALRSHPSLNAFVAQESASRAQARQAASRYFPTVSLSTGFRGNTLEALNHDFLVSQAESSIQSRRKSCEFNNALIEGVPTLSGEKQDCSQYVFTDEVRQEILQGNDVFPFEFTKLPLFVSLNVSVPVFTGFSRQRQVAQAEAAAEDAVHNRRAEELRLRTAVTQAYDNLVAAYEVVQLEERNRNLAEEQLGMQQRRYALGAAALLELMDAQTTLTTADQAYLNALYDFHWNLIRLEAAVGQSLRPERP